MPARPAFISKPSLNVYFGKNLQHLNDEFEMQRTAYGTGSGTNSIGLDQRTMRIYAIFPELHNLIRLVVEVVKEKTIYKNIDINFVSVKLYYWTKNENGDWVKKDTNWHCDVEHDKFGHPKENNSQLPGSPVIILTYGDLKSLCFRRHRDKTSFDKDSMFEFPQQSGSMFLLDGRDESPHPLDGMHWRHMSTTNRSEEGVTFALMFRTVQKSVRVNVFTNTKVDPVIPAWKIAQLEEAKDDFSTPHYKKQKTSIDGKLSKLLNK